MFSDVRKIAKIGQSATKTKQDHPPAHLDDHIRPLSSTNNHVAPIAHVQKCDDLNWTIEESANSQKRLNKYPMETNSLTQPVILSADSDATYVISQSMPGNCNSPVRGFPIQSTIHTLNSFPVLLEKSKERTSIAIMPNEFENIGHNLNHFTLMLKGLRAQENIQEIETLYNHVDAFPFLKLTSKTKKTFPIKTTESKELSIPKDIQISLKNYSSNKRLTFPLKYRKYSSKFPLKDSKVKQPNIQAKCWLSNPYTSSPKLKLAIIQFSEIAESLVHFPVSRITIKRQISKEKCSDKLVFPIKAEIFSDVHSTIIKECYNNNADNNTSSSTMTPSQYLANANICGGILVDTNNEIKTNLESYEHEKLEQEQEQDHPTSTFSHNNNDDMLAMGEAKNIFDSGQPKNCDELRHINEIQNSRSASETRCSHENMNDFQKQNQQQQIYGKTKTEPTTVTALAFNSVGNETQRDHQMVDFAPNATRNNISDKCLENQQEPWSSYLAHSEVRDPSSQEVLIVNRRVACENSISRIKAVHPPSEKSSYVNESTLLTSLTPTPSTTLTTAEAPHVQNDCQCLVDRSFCSISNANDFGFYNISTEIDGKGGEKSTNSRHSAETNVFVNGADNAMTLTKVVEVNEEENISVSSSQLDDNLYPISDERPQSGMKIDMKSSKLTPDVTTRSVGSNTRVKSDPGQVLPGSGSSVLAAATDVTKLANFGKTRRESSLLSQSRSTTSNDEKDSVLPPRTLLRRQRRLQSQGSEDKQEDPIERLNRLRARISGALTEVKGVLKHYSVDEAAETNETPALKNSVDVVDRIRATEQTNATAQSALKDEGPVSFRFVKKVRRRSVFTDDDDDHATNKVTKELTVENTEVTAKDDANKISATTEKGAKEEVRESSKDCNTNLTEIVHRIPEDHEEPKLHEAQQEKVEADNQNNIAVPAVPLGTQNEETNYNDSALESRLEGIEHEKIENVPKDEDKKQIKPKIINAKKSNRRASIALVEGSQIDPPVNSLIPLKIKTQRRPSDSEALIKQKTKLTDADSHSSIKKVKTIVKVKRPSVKSNADVITKNKKASNTEINQYENKIKDAVSSALEVSNAITSVGAVTAKTAITATVPKTSEKLSTQLAITIAINDASSLSSAEKPTDESTEATQPLSIATNNSRTPTKLVEQNSAMVAPLVSPLRTGESSSHTIKAETQPLSLLVNNSNIDTGTTKPTKDQHTNAELLNVGVQTQINESEDPTISKAQPITQTDCADHQSLDSKPLEISNQTSKDTAQLTILPSVPDLNIIETTKSDPDLSENQNSPHQQEDSQKLSSHSTEVCQSDDRMPEQQVAPTPVKPVQVFAENDSSKTNFSTKKTIIKRIVRKNSVDKAIEKKKPNNNSQVTVANTAEKHATPLSDSQPISDAITEKSESTEAESTQCEEVITPDESSLEAPIESEKPKKTRKVKKKVIIKRQQRKLSLGENTFFKEPEQPEASSASTETLERAIAYVTDEEDEASEPDAEPIKPIKSCIKQREFQVGDWVMYGERYRKTQIRWRKGQITERITSISYKINLDGTEVSAHISYIKKYTDRKVNFGGKEYLEIDYEQIAEEERRARTYSIWNMV